MPAGILWGKGFKIVEETTASAEPYAHVIGIEGGSDMLSWSSVEGVEALAEKHGVSREIWPIYPGCEMEEDIPLEDAMQRSNLLRAALEKVDPQVIEADYWLRFVWKLLREGHSFFIMP